MKTMRKEQNNVKRIVEDVLEYGDLLLISNKGCGKTNSLMVLTREFREMENTRVIIFESFPKWSKEFDSIPYFVIHDSDVEETSHIVDFNDVFLRHERDYTVKRGSEIKEALRENKDLIFVSEIEDIEREAFLVYSIVKYFYRKNYRKAWKQSRNIERIIFILEESQNFFEASVIGKKVFNRLRKIFNVARNLNIHFVMATQRVQDLNTQIRGRSRFLIGRVNIDDYELKVKRLLRHSKYRKEVLTLPKGVFVYPSLDVLVKFPLFKQNGKPFEYKPSTIEQHLTAKEEPKPSLWDRIRNWFRNENGNEDEECEDTYSEDLLTACDEDAFNDAIDEEFLEEW